MRAISPSQWRVGLAAWLGWLFDGLDIHLYTLVAAPFVMQLIQADALSDVAVKQKSSWIQAAFLIGWAVGGVFFGYLGDRLGRSRTLMLTILTYACFTGLSCVATTWWQLLLFRFLAALGIGGEWGVGAALLVETWPSRFRPWVAAVLQTGVNLGILGACLTVYLYAGATAWLGVSYQPRWVFLVGVLPALFVLWIRKNVPEPGLWVEANSQGKTLPNNPIAGHRTKNSGFVALFAPSCRVLTLKTALVCALSLTAWWAFMFWHPQHLRNLPELAAWPVPQREQLVSQAFFLLIAVSMGGNFFAGWLARRFTYPKAIAWMFLGFFLSMAGSFSFHFEWRSLVWFWFPLVGFFSGVFALFTMYLPALYPTLLRTTGAGFCFNVGRIGAAVGTVVFGLFSRVGDFRQALFAASFLLLAAFCLSWFLPPVLYVDSDRERDDC
jgi:MFS family permease